MDCFRIFYSECKDLSGIFENKNIKIRIDIDTNNPDGATFVNMKRDLPFNHEVKIFDAPSLFAGKIAAILCRTYKHRVKGRDYYDYLFYIRNGIKFNMKYLQNKLINNGYIDKEISFENIKELLKSKFNEVNFKMAVDDVVNFLINQDEVSKWNKELFISSLDYIYYQ